MNAAVLKSKVSSSVAICAFLLLFAITALAQKPAARITNSIVNSERAAMAGSHPSWARAEADAGAVPDTTRLEGMTLVFSRSAAQQAAIETLLTAQQNPASTLYHQWLTPDQFAARFGVADADLAAVQSWLTQQGFEAGAVARSRDRITFSGSAGQFSAAFGAPLHYFNVQGAKHFAPASDLTLPAALSPSVMAITNVSDFRPKSSLKRAAPEYTSAQTGSHYLTPKDISTIYDVNAAYSAGYTGTGQTIAVIGQSAVLTGDVTTFQTLSGVPIRVPQLVLVPGSGASIRYTDDESESDLDLEYSSALGRGASIYFVYTGSNYNYDVSDALTYAITNRVASIITLSYGYCELANSSTFLNSVNATLQQAALQGQTVIASSGDSGSTSCYGYGLSTANQQALTVNFPASSQYATAIGGTEFPLADTTASNSTYFSPASGTDLLSSALSYIPEVVWNDDSTSQISSSGGGVSGLFPRPTWQTGVAGIAAGTFRLVPDVSLDSSDVDAPYLYCSSDPSLGTNGSCVNGYRDANSKYLTAAGGTSFAAPMFAGMLAVISQSVNANGLGLINPTLYGLASNAITYGRAFHDITSGTNGCTAAPLSVPCTATNAASFAATTGYDEATGLGSIDLYNLLTSWPAVTTLTGSTINLSPATTTIAVNTNDLVTIQVAPTSGTSTATPTGTLTILLDGSTVATPTLASGRATYTFSTPTSGNHVIYAAYSGDAIFAPSNKSLVLTVSAIGTLTVSAPPLTITDGTTASQTITVTPGGGYTGSVGLSVSTTAAITNTCYSLNAVNITSAGAVTTTLAIGTTTSVCSGLTALSRNGGKVASLQDNGAPKLPARRPGPSVPVGASLAGLLAVGLLGRRSKRLRAFVVLAMLAAAGFGLSGCGDNTAVPTTGGTSSTLATKGSYVVTVTATDAVTPSITSSSTFTLTIQ